MLIYLSQKLDVNLILGFYQHVLELPMNFFGTRRVGEISELTWLEQRFEVNRQLHAINTAAVARAIAVADVNLIMSGLAA